MALFSPKGRNGEPLEDGLPESLRIHEKDEKQKKRINRLQKQYQDTLELLEGMTEEKRRLEFEQDRLRQQLASHGITPVILTNYEYLIALQTDELRILRKYCGKKQLIMLDHQFCVFLMEHLCIPSALHLFLFRKYNLFIHPSVLKPIGRIQSPKSRSILSESPTNPECLK